MRSRLRIPAVLVVALASAPACDDDYGPECRLFCIPSDPPPPSDAGPPVVDAAPVECPECSDDNGQCPVGCEAIG